MISMVGLLLKVKKIGEKYGSRYGTTEKTPPTPYGNPILQAYLSDATMGVLFIPTIPTLIGREITQQKSQN